METTLRADAGICGFKAKIKATSENGMDVDLKIVSGCETIKDLAAQIDEKTPIDAYEELHPNKESVILSLCRKTLVKKGCCEACVIPVAICKAMYIVAGLALPEDITLKIAKEKENGD